MKRSVVVPGFVFLLLVAISIPSAGAVQIGGQGTQGSFEGSVQYDYREDNDYARLTIQLTNTSPLENGGYITAIVLENPMGKVSGVVLSDSLFGVIGAPGFKDEIVVSPTERYDIGAGVDGLWRAAEDRQSGIPAGGKRKFRFLIFGANLGALGVEDFVEKSAQGDGCDLLVRFESFHSGHGEQVHATVASGPVAVTPVVASATVPTRYALQPNYPNPFNASTVINYQIPKAGHVSLTIYDVLGRKARELVGVHQQAGDYKIQWDGKDAQGREMKSGVYFCVLEAGSFSETLKMVLSR